jgi:hypothetical protein
VVSGTSGRGWSVFPEAIREAYFRKEVFPEVGSSAQDTRRLGLSASFRTDPPHRPEGQDHQRTFSPADARLHLLVTAVLSEYVSEVLAVGSA